MKGKTIICFKMKVTVYLGVLLCCFMGSNTLIIPDELPSLLSVIYSNIPTIKKGTDSRLGWGFRLGDRADFQVMLELGPQTNTKPLANQGDETSNTNKRNTLENLANVLYAQNQQSKKVQTEKKPTKKPTIDNGAAMWLKSWSDSAKETEDYSVASSPSQTHIPSHAKPGLGIGEIDAKSVIPEDSEVAEKRKKVETTTSKEDALDNVDLE